MDVTAGIPTAYHGTNFRSRLEARWAAFFDAVGWRWTYEPFDAAGYIPDFLIQGGAPFLVEVGPCVTTADYQEKAEKPLQLDQPVLVVGAGIYAPPIGMWGSAGLLTNDDWGSGPDWAGWARCLECRRVGVFHSAGSFRLLPCGHSDGNNHLGDLEDGWLDVLWRRAGNDTQWRGPQRIGDMFLATGR